MVNDCLYCKGNKIATKYVDETEEFKIYSRFCVLCNRSWKDYEGVKDAASPILSVQRQKNLAVYKQTSD